MSSSLALPVSGIYAHTPWLVERVTLDDFLRRCQLMEQRRTQPFAHSSWLRSWYDTLADRPGVEPLLLAARLEDDPVDAVLFPLVVSQEGLLSVARCADAGITDYNAPLLREGLQLKSGAAQALWKALRSRLKGCDVLRLDKLTTTIGQTPSPWLQMVYTVPSEMFGNRFRAHDDYGNWMRHIGKHARKEFERCWRVFSRTPQTRFVRATGVDEGLQLLRQLAKLQHQRQSQTPGYVLDQPAYTAFYEHFLQHNLDSGRCVLTALMCGQEMVAGLFSVFDGERLTMLRIAMAGDEWKACAPGKLLLERSIHAMHSQGCREFDFAIGDYQHKKVFLTTPLPLAEACVPLSLLGQSAHVAWRLKRALKAQPMLHGLASQMKARLHRQ